MKKRTVAMISLGCAKNLVDSEIMLGLMGAAGYIVGAEADGADVVIINTCAFIGSATEESESAIREAAELRRRGKCGKLVVAGCLPQRVRSKIKKKFPEIDLLVGTSSYPEIVSLIDNGAAESFAECKFVHDSRHPRLPATPPWRANLKIAEGCSNRCSYCVIPSIRGNFRSIRMDHLFREAEGLAELGAKELTIVAQDTTRYGSELGGGASLPALLEKLSAIEGIRWLRVMYAYPELVTDELADAIARLPKVCNYLDMPVQHISGGVLRAMNRRGGPEAIHGAIEKLRGAVPGICIRTTVLVGFPGETEEQFGKLLDFIGETKFDRLGAFAYSPEEGTKAAKMSGQIPDGEKQLRLQAVMELQQSVSLDVNASFVGKTLEALAEGEAADENGKKYTVARTYRDAPEIDGLFYIRKKAKPGNIISAKVTDANEYDLFGK